MLRTALGVSSAPCPNPEAHPRAPAAAPAPAPKERKPLMLGTSLVTAGVAGIATRDAYAKATEKMFSGLPTTRAQAEKMVTARGVERLGVRAVTVGVSVYSSYKTAQTHLENGDRVRAAAEMIPAAVTVGINTGMVVRDTVRYKNPLGGMAGPSREAIVTKMLKAASEGKVTSAARASAKATEMLELISKGMAHAGFLIDLSQLESDSAEMNAELKEKEEAAKASGEWGCNKALGGLINVCGPTGKKEK